MDKESIACAFHTDVCDTKCDAHAPCGNDIKETYALFKWNTGRDFAYFCLKCDPF